MTFHYLGYPLQSLYYLVKLLRVLQLKTDIGAGFIAYLLWIYDELGTFQDTHIGKFLNTLVNGCTAYIASAGNLKKWYSGILGNEAKDFLVQII